MLLGEQTLSKQEAQKLCRGFLPCMDILTRVKSPPKIKFPGSFIFFIETRDLEQGTIHRIEDSMLCDDAFNQCVGMIVEPDAAAFGNMKQSKDSSLKRILLNYQATQSRDCIAIFTNQRPKDQPSTVVVIPSVKRKTDEYLQHTLLSLAAALEYASPASVKVFLINANPKPYEHTYLTEWCKEHAGPQTQYSCLIPESIPDKIYVRALQLHSKSPHLKKRQSAEYIRWRTAENVHAHFALTNALKTKTAKTFIWLQDDVIISPRLFTHLLKGRDIVCLRTGRKYCGAVAYSFSRMIVERILAGIESRIYEWPLDWIIDRMHGGDVKTFRQELVKHIGLISSNGRRRGVDAIAQLHGKSEYSNRHHNFRLNLGDEVPREKMYDTASWESNIKSLRLRKCAPMSQLVRSAVKRNDESPVVVDFWSVNMKSSSAVVGALQGVDWNAVAFRAIEISRHALENRSAVIAHRVETILNLLSQMGYHDLPCSPSYCLFISKDVYTLPSSGDQDYNIGIVDLSKRDSFDRQKVPLGSFLNKQNVNDDDTVDDKTGRQHRQAVWLFISASIFITCCGTIVLLYVHQAKVGSGNASKVEIRGRRQSVQQSNRKKKKKKTSQK